MFKSTLCLIKRSIDQAVHSSPWAPNMFHSIVDRRFLAVLALGLAGVGLSDAQVQVQGQNQNQNPLANDAESKVVKVAFSEFFQMPFGPKGLTFTKKAKALVGQRVSITGYMVKMEQPIAGQFILSPRPVEINDHADGDANDLPAHAVLVLLDTVQAEALVPYRSGLVQIEGQLELGRQETGQAQVSWIRLRLDKDAVRMQAHQTPVLHLAPHG